MVTLFAILAIIFYIVSCTRQFLSIGQSRFNRTRTLAIGAAAALCHGASWFSGIAGASYVDLGFFNVGSLISLVISSLILISAIKKPVENLLLGIFPMSAVILACATFIPADGHFMILADAGLLTHVILSIVAYSVLTIAAFQALLLMLQNRQLKHKHMGGIVSILPPLQTMDRLLFELLGIGTLLLTLAIASGFIFLNDLFAQHLVHKTAFTLMAWGIFSFLLFAHWRFGWRGNVAGKWTLAGTAFLIMAYFGSKLVLELILDKV
jgi:ABC-type uncharacterized transport system permease subunit